MRVEFKDRSIRDREDRGKSVWGRSLEGRRELKKTRDCTCKGAVCVYHPCTYRLLVGIVCIYICEIIECCEIVE